MLRCSTRLLFYIPRTPVEAAEARRATQGAPSTAQFQRISGGSVGGFRNDRQDIAGGTAAKPRFSEHTESGTRSLGCSGGFRRNHRCSPGRTLKPGEHLPPPLTNSTAQTHDANSNACNESYISQRQAYRRQKAERERKDGNSFYKAGVAGSYFTPLPRQYGFYDGVDMHAVETPQPSRQERREQLRASLEAQAASVVEFTDGGESDIEMNGLPAEQYHGHAGWTTIPKDSALYHTMYATGDLESRQRTNSWGVAMRHCRSGSGSGGSIGDLLGESGAAAIIQGNAATDPKAGKGEEVEVLDDHRRRRQHDESLYSTALEGELLAPTQESIGHPRSTYALRKMFVNGLVGYQGMISRAEEAAVSEELLQLLQSPRAAYIAEEARYCVNLYETELGIPGKDTLAFALSSCPTLQRVLYRFFFLGLIPAVPNVCQVSEMVGNFSGYPVHRHPQSIGCYIGILNLVSTSVLHLQHRDAPWYPRLHLTPRSLFVVTEPCLGEYAMGYKQTQQPFHAFEYATRVSKDYRIEVLFATVETAQMRTLSEAVQLTEYASSKIKNSAAELPLENSSYSKCGGVSAVVADGETPSLSASCASSISLQGSTDEWLQQLRAKLHPSGSGDCEKSIDGHALRRQLLAHHVVGAHPRGEAKRDGPATDESRQRCSAGDDSRAQPPSAAQRRLAALKARFEFSQSLKASKQQVELSNSGPRLIRGHSPKDRYVGIK